MERLFVDAETDGLYGSFLSVAAVVTDDSGSETDLFYGVVKDFDRSIQSEWVKKNVLPFIKDTVRSEKDYYESEYDLIEAFYSFYLRHRDSSVIADVCCPVEARLFEEAVMHNLSEREYQAPYPLLDLSSMLFANGISPLADRRSLVDCCDLRPHNALDDVRMSIRLFEMINREGR